MLLDELNMYDLLYIIYYNLCKSQKFKFYPDKLFVKKPRKNVIPI